MADQNQIVGKLIAVAKAKFVPGEKEKGSYDQDLEMKIDPLEMSALGIDDKSLDDCVDQVLAIGDFKAIKEKYGYHEKDGEKYVGLTIISKKDPRISCVVDLGNKNHNSSDYFWLNDDSTDLTFNWYLDAQNERKEQGDGAVQERSVSADELDLISKIREATKETKIESTKPMLGHLQRKLTESKEYNLLFESAPIDDVYDTKSSIDLVVKSLRDVGFNCKPIRSREYQTECIDVVGIDLLWLTEGIDKVTIESDLTDKKSVLSLNEGRVSKNSSFSALVKHLETLTKGTKMQFNEDFMKVDSFGLPLLSESDMPIKEKELSPKTMTPEQKEAEVNKKADNLSTKEAPIKHVGDALAKPAAKDQGDVKVDEKDLEKSKLKVGAVGDDSGEHVAGSGSSDDQQKDLGKDKVKLGAPGDDHGKVMSEWKEKTKRAVAAHRNATALKLESLEAKVKELTEMVEKNEKGKMIRSKMEAHRASMGGMKKPVMGMKEVEKKPDAAEVKKESKGMPASARAKLREMMAKRKK